MSDFDDDFFTEEESDEAELYKQMLDEIEKDLQNDFDNEDYAMYEWLENHPDYKQTRGELEEEWGRDFDRQRTTKL